jgi:hypothetical protein
MTANSFASLLVPCTIDEAEGPTILTYHLDPPSPLLKDAMSTSPNTQDFELELGRLRDGYPTLATWIARDPDNETFVVRKFDRLGARNILHLQSQLIALEKEIDDLDENARQSSDLEARQSSHRWETLMKHASDENRPEKERVEKLDKLKACLKEYCPCCS